jgi:hypothetical protein
MSDTTLTLGRSSSPMLRGHTARLLALAAALVLVATVAMAVVALAWPSSSTEPAREGTGATSAVAERIDCWPGRPC